jgi:hypothetical protein
MKKILIAVIILFISISAGYSEAMLFGITFIFDDTGRVYSGGGYELRNTEFPFVLLIDFSDEYDEATLHYQVGHENKTEKVATQKIDRDSPLETFQLQTETYGDISFHLGNEVLADDLGAAVSAYQIRVGERLYTAVGALAAKEFQEDEEQQALLDEIIDEVTQ